MSKEKLRMESGGYHLSCPNCRETLVSYENNENRGEMDGPGVALRCHVCHAAFVVEEITYKLRRMV